MTRQGSVKIPAGRFQAVQPGGKIDQQFGGQMNDGKVVTIRQMRPE